MPGKPDARVLTFRMKIGLNHDEAVVAGADAILPKYLAEVAKFCEAGRQGAMVVDGNGNTIGDYTITYEPYGVPRSKPDTGFERWFGDLVDTARALVSDEGQNPEYDKALTDLLVNVGGVDPDHRFIISLLLRAAQS